MINTFLPRLKYFLINLAKSLGAFINAVLIFAMMSEMKDVAMN